MAKLTREEKREAERQARIGEKVAEFKTRIVRERAKRIYSDQAAWEHDEQAQTLTADGHPRPRSGMALYEMVSTFRNLKRSLLRDAERAQERLTDLAKRLGDGDTSPFGSAVLGGLPADIEAGAASLKTQADAIARVAWATGWYVEEIMPAWELRRRNILINLSVRHDPTRKIAEVTLPADTTHVYEVWNVYVGDRILTMNDVADLTSRQLPAEPTPGGDVPLDYRSEVSAWVAAARLVGETLD